MALVVKNPKRCMICRFNPWLGKIPRVGNGNSLQYSCLGNSMDTGGYQATVHGIAKELDFTKILNNSNNNTESIGYPHAEK